MAKTLNKQQRKFRTAAKTANAICHRETNSVAGYKSCMRREMKAGLGSKKKSRKGRRRRRR